MIRDLQHIPLADLKVSKLNVRKHGARDIDSLAASIAAIGVIQPLLVRKNCEGFDVVAGQRRYLAARKLGAAAHPNADPLPCMVLAADDDAAAIEASLAENDPLLASFAGAQLVVRVRAERIFPNCPRYIHRMSVVEASPYVPREGCAPPVPGWKKMPQFNEVLPPGDPARE